MKENDSAFLLKYFVGFSFIHKIFKNLQPCLTIKEFPFLQNVFIFLNISSPAAFKSFLFRLSLPLNYFLSSFIHIKLHLVSNSWFISTFLHCFGILLSGGKISRARFRCMLLRANFNSSTLVSRGIFLYVQNKEMLKESIQILNSHEHELFLKDFKVPSR